MANFTIELYKIREQAEAALTDYPIFSEEYRETLNAHILDNYDEYEIGSETVERFLFRLGRKMRLIMPRYNKLYESTKLQFDPLSTIDISTVTEANVVSTQEGTSNGSTESTNLSESRAVQMDTPQVALGGKKDYASAAADSFSTATGEGSTLESSESSANQDSESSVRQTGYQGSPAALLAAYRQSLINVDEMVLEELRDLFMLVWNTADNYLPYETRSLPAL